MAGGILQLVARSPDDIYLTSDPDITLFKTIYRRYSNFSIDNKNLKFNKNVSFDSKGTCNIKKYGDLLHKLYLVINIPEIDLIYKSLTNQDVYDILYTAEIIWNYSGNPSDKVQASDLPDIYETIINAMNEYEQNITLIQINNLLPLNELYNYYSNNTINDQSGIYFLQNYIGGIDSYDGIIYNQINDEPIDPSVTKSIVSEYNFTQSYYKDVSSFDIANLNIVQNETYKIFLNYTLDTNYDTSYTGTMSSVTTNSITFDNIKYNNIDLNYNVIYDEFFKNCYIKNGLEISYIHSDSSSTYIKSYDNTSHEIITLNNFNYLPNITNETVNIINTPITYLNGVINDKKLVITIEGNPPDYNIFNYYKNWLCIFYSGNIYKNFAFQGTCNPIGTFILNSDNYNYNNNNKDSYINMISNLNIEPDSMSNFLFLSKNYDIYYVDRIDVSNGYDLIYINDTFNIIDNFNNNYNSYSHSTNNTTRYSTFILLHDLNDPNLIRPFPTYNHQFNEFNVNYIRLMQDTNYTPFANYALPNIDDIIYTSNIIQLYSSTIAQPFYYGSPPTYPIYYNQVFVQIDKDISNNINQQLLLFDNNNAYIYDASSITDFVDPSSLLLLSLSNTLILNNLTNSYVQFINNNIGYVLLDDPVITGNIVDIQYINKIIYTDISNTITNYTNMYLFYNNEMHQIMNSDISNTTIILNIKDIFNDKTITNYCDIITSIDYYAEVNSATNNTVQFISSSTNFISDISGYYIYYNQQLNKIISFDTYNYTVTINNNWNDIPLYKNVCYLINPNNVISKNINNVNIIRNTLITLDNNTNNYKNIIINNKLYDIHDTISSKNILIDTTDFINTYNSYSLINTLDNSGTIIDVCGTRILYVRSYQDMDWDNPSNINNEISQFDHFWFIYFNNQNFTVNNLITNLMSTSDPKYVNQIILNKNIINIPKSDGSIMNTIATNILTEIYNNTIGITKNNLIIRINDNTDIDYIDYYIIINNQKTKIIYYDIIYKLCILENKLINMNIVNINSKCILFKYYTITDTNTILNAEIINNQCIIYLNYNASSENNYYNNWYIEIINSNNNVSEVHKILSYNGSKKAAILDSYFINGIPLNGIYNLINNIDVITTNNIKLSNNVFSLNLDNNNTSNFVNLILSINNENSLITYYNNDYRICILEKEFYQQVNQNMFYIIIKSLPEQHQLFQSLHQQPYNYAVQLQKYNLSLTNNAYLNNYIKIGNEMHIITNYDSTYYNFMIDSSGWLNINDISNNYSIYDISFNNFGKIINYDNIANITTISGDLSNNNYIFANNQIYDVSNYTVSGLYYDVIINWIVNPNPNDDCALVTLTAINNPLVCGIINNTYPTGIISNSNNIVTIDKYYDNWYLNISDISDNVTNSQIQKYYGDTTFAVLSGDPHKNIQPFYYNSVQPNTTPYKLFSRMIDNYEINKITNIDLSLNTIILPIQSSKISNYYNDWYIDVSNTNYKIISYNGNTYTATVSGLNNISINDIYHLKNYFLKNNYELYNIINLGISDITQYNINLSIKEVFDNMIPPYYYDYDMYYAYLQYFIDNDYTNYTYVNINYMTIKMNLLLYIYNTVNSNIRQLYAIINTLNYTKYQDPHYMFLFYFYGTIFNNASLSNNNISDNFTNYFTIINPYYYANYINSCVTNFHYTNNSYFNDTTYSKYFKDSQIWKYNGINILSSDISGLYLLDNIPLIIGNDICNLVKSRLLYYNTDSTFVNNLYDFLINKNNIIVNLLNKNLNLTDGDISYIKSIIINTNNENIIIALFKKYNTYFINNPITLSNIPNKPLSPLEYTCFTLLNYALIYTSSNYTYSNINNIYIYIKDAIDCFMTPKTNIPAYETYVINNYKFQASDPSNLSYLISSIYNNIFNLLIKSYNNFYQSILNVDYYKNNLGLYIKYILIKSYEILSIDFNNDIDFYNYNTPNNNKVFDMINAELNSFNSLYNNYNTYSNILYIKHLIITPYSLYYDTFDNIYNALQNAISNYIYNNQFIFYPYFSYIFNETKYMLQQFINCPMDIIGDSSENYVNTFINAFYSLINPFNQNNQPNLFNWYNTYKSDASYNEFIDIVTNITANSLYNDKYNINGFYNGFKQNINVIQYIADTFAKYTDIKNLFKYVKNDWLFTYNNLLKYFNSSITKDRINLNKIGYTANPPTMYTEINNAVINQTPYFAWIKYLGYYIIDSCSITIGGCEIDKHTGEYMAINNTIDHDSNKQNGLDHMIGNLPELYTYDSNKKKSMNLYIPLNFWFSTNALPLIAMNYTEIDLNISLKKLEDVAYWSSLSMFKKKPVLKTSVIAQYIYIDEHERTIISKSKHEHLIEHVQSMNYTFSYKDIKNNSIDPYIYFNNMCKELIWSIQPDNNYNNYNNISGFEPKWYEYGFNNGTINTHIKGIYKWDSSFNTTYYDINNNPSPWISHDGTMIDISGAILPLQYIINSNNYNIPHNNLYYDSIGNLHDDTHSIILNKYIKDSSNNIYILDGYLCDSSINYINPSKSIIINMNGNHREEIKDYMYYNFVQPNVKHKTSLPNGIYSYSFAIYPKLFQPSGALNLSKIENVNLVIELNQNLIQAMKYNQTKIKCVVYAKTYNILRIFSGMAGLAFFG